MTQKDHLLNKLANFKKACRRVAADCISEDQEWVLATCYSRINRLGAAGIANKHAGIKGMPAMTEGEKEAMMQTLLELKGKGSKKNKSEHQMGRLQIKSTPFSYTRFAEAIEARSGSLPHLANAFAVDAEPHAHEKPLMQVLCPKCGSQRSSKGLKLQRIKARVNGGTILLSRACVG